MNSPLRWQGGKGRVAERIVNLIPPHAAYVETCCGGASVFWHKSRESSRAEILNDRDGELINFYYELRKHGRRLAEEVNCMPYSRALLDRVKRSRPRGPFQRAVRFWYLNRVSFGGRIIGATFGVAVSGRRSVVTERIWRDLDAIIERLAGVSFESVDVARCLKLYDRRNTFFYVDPPYCGTSQDYAASFGQEDHSRLAEALGRVSGTWLLSYNDCPEVRRLYAGHPMRGLSTRWTAGCNSRSHPAARQWADELLISNRRPFSASLN
jgi:DNA adenine methylase